MQDYSDFYTFDPTGVPTGGESAPKPAPGFWEAFQAADRLAGDDSINMPYRRLQERYAEVAEEAAAASGVPLHKLYVSGKAPNPETIWGAIRLARQRDPKAFATIPATRDEFEKQFYAEDQKRHAADRETEERSGWVPWLLGSVTGMRHDPFAWITAPVGGGGSTVTKRIVTEGVAQMVVEGIQQPTIVAPTRQHYGETLTLKEMALNTALAGLFGSTLQGVGEAGAAVVEKGIGKRLRETIGDDRLTDEERAAADVLDREDEMAATSPFVPGAGTEAHVARIAEAMAELQTPTPAPRAPVAEPVAVPRGTPQPVPQAMPREQFMARVRRQESGGDDAARNPKSTATGRYQFVDGTWLRYHKRVVGGEMSDAARLAQRTDGAVQERLMQALTADNAAALARAGAPETAGNLYLMHFAGQGGAGKILRAAPDTPIEQLLTADAIRANPFLRGKSASDVVRWAHRVMGEEPHTGPVLRRDQLPQDAAGDDAWAEAQRAVDAEEAYRLATQRRLDDAVNADGLPARDPVMIEPFDAIDPAVPARGMDWEPGAFVAPARAADAVAAPGARAVAEVPLPPEVKALLPDLRKVVADRKRSLNRLEPLADELGVPVATLRRGLMELVSRGGLRMDRKRGRFMRAPEDGPVDVLKFIARNGGLRDDEGHALGLEGLSAKEQRELTTAAKRNVRRNREGRRKDSIQRAIPGAGWLLRHEGKSLDAMGELLVEGGYFHGKISGDLWDEDEVLDLVQRALAGEKIYPRGDDPFAEPPFLDADGWQVGEREAYSAGIAEAAAELGLALTEREILTATWLRREAGWDQRADAPYTDASDAVLSMVNREMDAARWDALEETNDIDYEAMYDDLLGSDARETGAGGEGSGGPAADGGDAGAERAGGADGRGGDPAAGDPASLKLFRDAPEIPQAQARIFDDPDGAGARAQVESLEHDAQMALLPRTANVPPDAVDGEWLLGPATVAAKGEPGFHIEDTWGDGNVLHSVFRDENGTARAVLEFPATDAARAPVNGIRYDRLMVFVDPAYRRQGIATKLYDQLRAAGHDVDALMGASDLTPDGAAFTNARKARLAAGQGDDGAQAGGWPAIEDDAGWDAVFRPLDEDQRTALVSSLWGNDAVYSAALDARSRVADAEWEEGAAARATAALAEAKAQAAVLRAHMDAGGTLTSTTARTQLTINAPDQLRVADDGTVLMMERGKFVALTPQQREQLARRVGWKPEQVEPDMFGGPTPADVRASLERAGEGRAKGKVEQKAPGSDGGLFDVQAQDMKFRLEADGPEVTPRQMLDDLAAEEADIRALRECLPPAKPGNMGTDQ